MGNRSCREVIDYDYRSGWNLTCIDKIKKGCEKTPKRIVNVSPCWIGGPPVGFENMKSVRAYDPTNLTHASYLDHKIKHKPVPIGSNIESFIEGMGRNETALFNQTKQNAHQAQRAIQGEVNRARSSINRDRHSVAITKNQNIGGIHSDRRETSRLKNETAGLAQQARNQNNSSQHSAGQANRAKNSAQYSERVSRDMKHRAIVSERDADIASENSLVEAGKSHSSSEDSGVSSAIAQQKADEAAESAASSQQLAADQQVILNNTAVAAADENSKNEKRQIAALSGSLPDSPEMLVKGSTTHAELETIQDTTDQVIGALVESGGQSEGVPVQGFANYEGFGNKKKNIEGFTQSGQLTASQATQMGTDFMQSLHRFRNILTNERQVTAEHNRIAAMNEIAELSAAKKDIGTDIFLDYISSDDGSDIHKVYEKKKYDNLKNERLIQTQEYEMRIYEEYINIAKVLVIAFVIYAIFAFLNSKSIVGDQLTKILNVIIIACAIFFTIGKLIWLALRDPINFDKTNQGYDRQYIHDMSGNKYPSKSYNLGMFSGTCVGEACCGPGMIYNSGENSCVEAVAEGFGNNLNGSLIEGMDVKKAQQEILENMFQQTQ
jgi:hypothetical protein